MIIRRITRAKRVHDSHAVHALARQVSLPAKKTSLCVYRRARMLYQRATFYCTSSNTDRPISATRYILLYKQQHR